MTFFHSFLVSSLSSFIILFFLFLFSLSSSLSSYYFSFFFRFFHSNSLVHFLFLNRPVTNRIIEGFYWKADLSGAWDLFSKNSRDSNPVRLVSLLFSSHLPLSLSLSLLFLRKCVVMETTDVDSFGDSLGGWVDWGMNEKVKFLPLK